MSIKTFGSNKLCLNFSRLKFKFSNDLDGETTKAKVVELENIYNIAVDNFYI